MGKGLTKSKASVSGASGGGGAAVAACKKALKTGTVSTYGELQKTTGDGTADRDHIPSYKSLEKRATKLAKRPLTKPEKARVKRAGLAIVLKKSTHKRGRTYGGKNTAAQTTADSQSLSTAATADVAAYHGIADATEVTAMQSMIRTDAEYDQMLEDAINGV